MIRSGLYGFQIFMVIVGLLVMTQSEAFGAIIILSSCLTLAFLITEDKMRRRE